MTNPAAPTGRILLKNVRLAFPNLWEPSTVAGEGKLRYSASLLLATDHPQVKDIEARMRAVAREKWGAKADAVYAGLAKSDKLALHDGDTKDKYDGFPGNLFVAAAAQENAQPTVIDADKAPLSQRSGRPYAGCYVNAAIDFWAQDNVYGKRINAQLRGVQFLRDGDAFAAGRPADSEEFDDVSEGSDAPEFA